MVRVQGEKEGERLRDSRSIVHRTCSGKGCGYSGEGISIKVDVASHELRLSLKVLVAIAKTLQMEEL